MLLLLLLLFTILTTGPQTDITLLQTHHLTVGRTILLASGSEEFVSVAQGPPDTSFPASIVYSQSQELPSLVVVTSKTAAFLSQSGHVGVCATVPLCHFSNNLWQFVFIFNTLCDTLHLELQ